MKSAEVYFAGPSRPRSSLVSAGMRTAMFPSLCCKYQYLEMNSLWHPVTGYVDYDEFTEDAQSDWTYSFVEEYVPTVRDLIELDKIEEGWSVLDSVLTELQKREEYKDGLKFKLKLF
jgi:hypothetical protein